MSLTHTEVTAVVEPCGKAEHPDCGIRDLLTRVGDTWSVFVVVQLASGDHRFTELQRAIDGISQRMLTLTLRRLERDGLVARTVFPSVPAQVSYALTESGSSLTHLVKALADWSLQQRPAIEESRGRYDAANPDHQIR